MMNPVHTPISVQADSRLCIIPNGNGTETVLYLGYTLRLSPDEARLLHILLGADPAQADSQGFTAVETVLQTMRNAIAPADPFSILDSFSDFPLDPRDSLPRLPYSKEQIAILVSRINRKAFAIGGRKLILGKSHHGYRMNPYM